MKHIQSIWITGCLMILSIIGQAQEPTSPTLDLGLDAISFTQGTLDTELLSELLTGKQEEIRKDAINRIVNKTLKDAPFAVQQYVRSSLEVITTEKNEHVIKKELMANMANMALVIGFSEYYLQTINVQGNAASTMLKALSDTVRGFNTAKTFNDATKLSSLTSGTALANPLTQINGTTATYKVDGTKYNVSISGMLIDVVFDVCSESKELPKLGFFEQPLGVTNQEYQENSLYYTAEPTVKPQLDALKLDIAKRLRLIIKGYQFLKEANNIVLTSSPGTFLSHLTKFTGASALSFTYAADGSGLTFGFGGGKSYTFINNNADTNRLVLYDLTADVLARSQSSLGAEITTLRNIDLKFFESDPDSAAIKRRVSDQKELQSIIQRLGQVKPYNDYKLSMEWLTWLEDEAEPFILEVMSRYDVGAAGAPDFEKFKQLLIALNTVRFAVDCLNEGVQLSQFAEYVRIPSHLMEFAKRLDRLDEIETYQYIIPILTDLGSKLIGESQQNIINFIVNQMGQHVVLDKNENKLEFDLEPMLFNLYDKLGKDNPKPIRPYFVVGLGHYQFNTPQNIYDEETDTITGTYNNAQLYGEKIGVEWSFFNTSKHLFLLSKNSKRFNTKPWIKDVHAIAYASGVLYTWVNKLAGARFSDPIIGTGLGFTFFNNLDVNFTIATPLYKDMKFKDVFDGHKRMFGISLDIQFTEYYKALREKRLRKKEEKSKQAANMSKVNINVK